MNIIKKLTLFIMIAFVMTLAINALPLGTFAPTCAQITDDASIHEILDTDTEISGKGGDFWNDGGNGSDANPYLIRNNGMFSTFLSKANNGDFEEIVYIRLSGDITINTTISFSDSDLMIVVRGSGYSIIFDDGCININCAGFRFEDNITFRGGGETSIINVSEEVDSFEMNRVYFGNLETSGYSIISYAKENTFTDSAIGSSCTSIFMAGETCHVENIVLDNSLAAEDYIIKLCAKENVIVNITDYVAAGIFLGGENNFVDNYTCYGDSTNAIYINCADLSVNCIMRDCSFNGTCTTDIYVSSSTKALGNVPRVYIIDCTYTTLAVQNNVSGLVSVITTS